jgi:hypothetical protein
MIGIELIYVAQALGVTFITWRTKDIES